MDQGRVAGRNMAGKPTPYQTVPFFWTQQYGVSIRYAGHAFRFDRVVIEGELDKQTVAAYYVDGKGTVLAVVTLKMDPVAAAAQELMRTDKMPNVSELEGRGPRALLDLIR